MYALKMTLNEIERNMSVLAPYRKPALFNEFLLQGYSAVTLSSVPTDRFSEILRAKLCLGTLITLYDDYADRPSTNDPQLLEGLYRLSFSDFETSEVHPAFGFAKLLFSEMNEILGRQPHRLMDILEFDLQQFYSANRYSSLVTAHPQMKSSFENRMYAHHNMGMVIAAMMDLCASENLVQSELGVMREVFLMGQRMGRIFNVLATHKREVLDGDVTGELPANVFEAGLAKRDLRREIRTLSERILSFENQITTFSVSAYVEGLMKVQSLHERMEGTI